MNDHATDELVFLSSLCRGAEDIRQAAFDLVNGSAGLPYLYVDEISNPRSEEEREKQFFVLHELIERLSKSDAVIVIVTDVNDRPDDHGFHIYNSEVSFWEIELYHCAILQLPVYLIIEEGIDWNSRPLLQNVLQILPSFPDQPRVVPRDRIAQTVFQILQSRTSAQSLQTPVLLEVAQKARTHPFDPELQIFDKGLSSIRFRHIRFFHADFNEALVIEMLAAAEKELIFPKKISLLYLAYRELMKVPYWTEVPTPILAYWAQVSFELSEALRWYGVHGHIEMGVIQHTADYAFLRQLLAKRGMDIRERFAFSHYGAFASEYFSLYKYVKGDNMYRAFENISLGLRHHHSEKDYYHLLSIRGSCYLEKWKFGRALEDFRSVLTFKEKNGGSVNEIAQYQAKLGLAYFGSGRFRKGLSLARESLNLFESEDADKVRALRITAKILKYMCRYGQADELLKEAATIAKRIGAIDQVQKIRLR